MTEKSTSLEGSGLAVGYPTSADASLLEDLGIASEADFFAKLQNPVTRIKSRQLLEDGAFQAYNKFADNFQVSAASLCILSHRFLEPDTIVLDGLARQKAEWLTVSSGKTIEAGLLRIEESRPRWEDVRWTCSLAVASGFLLLCLDRKDEALRRFQVAADLVKWVHLSKVSALNFLLAHFMVGLLSRAVGDLPRARLYLEQGVLHFKDVSGVQDLMRNFWVLGDIQNMAVTSRQCFVALARWGLLERAEPIEQLLPPSARVDIGQLKCPLQKIVRQGLVGSLDIDNEQQ